MESSWPENIPSDRRKAAIEELIRGREYTNRLRVMVNNSIGVGGGGDDGESMTAEDLVIKIMGSFTETVSLLNSRDSDRVSQSPAVDSGCWDGRKSEESGESSKTSALKDRRGCYKRRKTSQTWTKFTPTLIDDGHAWRKYGQKVILNAKHPRNYFRCTHKFDQGCQATKQVQRTEDDDPPMHRITYHGHHTCKNLLKAPQIILDSTTTVRDSSILLSFEANYSSNMNNIQRVEDDDPYFASLVKHEYKDDIINLPSVSCNPMPAFEMSSGSDQADVISTGMYSCTESVHSFEMDVNHMMMGPDDFDDVLQFPY